MAIASSNPVGLLQGFDRALSQVRNTALIGSTQTFGGEIFVRYVVCEGEQEVLDELEIDQSLSIGLFGVLNMSQNLRFVNRQRLSTHSVCIMVTARHRQGTTTATDVALHDDVNRPTSSVELKDFYQVYGDSYVSSRTIGGEYIAMYSFYSETLEEQREITAGMRVAGIFSSFVGDAGLQTSINNFRSSQNIRISFDQIITGIAKPDFPAAEDVLDFALNFSALELTAPTIIRIRTTSYQRVPGIASNFNTIANNVQHMTNGNLAAHLHRAQELQVQVKAITDIYKFYGGYADPELERVQRQIEEDIEALQEMVEAFEEDPTTTSLTVPVVTALPSGTPTLQFETQYSQMHNLNHIIESSTDPDNIQLWSMIEDFDNLGEDIRRRLLQRARILAFEMSGNEEKCNDLRVVFNDGQHTWTAQQGMSPDSMGYKQLLVPEGQFVKLVQGGSSLSRTFLNIELTNGDTISMGANTLNAAGQVQFVERTPPNFFLLGFKGANSSFLHRLQMVYAAFRPAVWL